MELKADLVKLRDFKIRMRRVKLLSCMEEKGRSVGREPVQVLGVTTQI